MKGRTISAVTVCLFVLALVLIAVGIVCGAGTFSHFEQLAQLQQTHEQLLSSMRITAVYSLVFGSMAVVGIGIIVILFLHLIRRTSRIEREARALRKKNEAMEEWNQKLQKLAHHQRLETIGTLTSALAHEFNNLLTPIMGYSLMALEKLPPEQEDLYDDILEIYQASQKAKSILSRLSDLSRKNSGNSFRLISPDEQIRKTLHVASPAKPPKVEIKLDLNCWDQRIWANEIQVAQLLLNLILNGFQAMEQQGGVLTISTAFDEDDIRIRVADTGCGIPEELLPRIFEPFFTTKETGKGTGLGLSIAAQVVEDHRGEITVDSTVGSGTVFTIRLPRTREVEKEL